MSNFVRALKYGRFLLRVRLTYALAFIWRLALIRTTFIAITGSVGTTTAKAALHNHL